MTEAPPTTQRTQSPSGLVDAVCDQHASRNGESPAIVHERSDGSREIYSFARLRELSERFANVLGRRGIAAGDRVALLLAQDPAFPIAVLACWRIGAIAVPIAPLFSGQGLLHRLRHSGARAIVSGASGCETVAGLRDELGDRDFVVWCTDAHPVPNVQSFWDDVDRASPRLLLKPPAEDCPAYMMYTSGTTGPAKGALHTHGGFLATLRGGALFHHDVQPDDVAWSPASWAWIAGFGGLLFFFLAAGRPVVAWDPPHPFDPERVHDFIARNRIRNTLLTPTMLRMMSRARAPGHSLRTMLCTGEAVDPALAAYCSDTLGVLPSEAYGQTECAPITVSNPALRDVPSGSLGCPVTGMTVAIIGPDGEILGTGERGEIAIRRDHPSVFNGYWCDPETTATKFQGKWMMTGDEGWRDEEGFYWFLGRNDDVIKSSGYRIGPGEIEACLARHPAVELVAAFGLPDAQRGSLVAAAVKVRDGVVADQELAANIVGYGRQHLERHEYPRSVHFIDTMPLTETGKVVRREVRSLFCEPGSKRC